MIRKIGALKSASLALIAGLLASGPAWAVPEPWKMNFQTPNTEIMERIISFHSMLLVIITLITLFVLVLLVWIMLRYNARANPVPSATTHNNLLEVAWTLIPVVILAVVAIPSFRLLYAEETIPKADLTIKAIGKQWYWTYQYPDDGGFQFDSLGLSDADAAKAGEPRLLGTDNHVVVPVGKVVRVITTGADVIHSWAMPQFGVKMDAIPGRINQTWFKAERVGKYYGECSELCGARHAFMPIEVEVVTQEQFDAWVADAKMKYAGNGALTRFAAKQ